MPPTFHSAPAFDRANPFQKLMRRLSGTALGARFFSLWLHHADKPVARLTKGRHTVASLFAGLPIVMLTTTGAKSGKPRTVPLLGLPFENGIAVIASNYGRKSHPAWYYNLRKDPSCEFTIDGTTHRARAVEALEERRERIWAAGSLVHPDWRKYEGRAAHRFIHAFVLEPVE